MRAAGYCRAESASSDGLLERTGLDRALSAVESRSARALVVTDVTRLSTTLADVAWLMDASRRRKWALVSLAESVRSDDPALPFLSVVDAFAPVIAYVTFDCEEPESLADFWAAATGYRKESTPEPGEYAVLSDLSGRGPAIWFNKVPERKVVKNRVHLCLNVHAVDSEIERLVALGAEKS